MGYPAPPITVKLSPNYSQGRQGKRINFITFHHTAATAISAVNKFSNPASQTSSHFVVGETEIWCCVDTDDTAWTNGNWNSNLECITIEHHGDWRNGYYNQKVIDNSAKLVAWLRSLYPGISYNRHNQVAQTICPGDLPVEQIWNAATALLTPEPPKSARLTVTDIVNKIVVTKKDTNLWDLSFTKWSEAKSVKVLPKGTELEVSATCQHELGGLYYLTEYSFSKGINNGINVVDCEDKPTPVPPVPPIPPTPPSPYPNWFIEFWMKLWEAIKNILGIK